MKKIVLFLLCFSAALLPCGIVFAEGMQTITVTSDKNGADVMIDGVLAGVTPLTGFPVSPGTHSVEVSLRGYITAAGHVSNGGTFHAVLQPELYPQAYADKLIHLVVDNAALTLPDAVSQAMADPGDTWYLIEFAEGIDEVCLTRQLQIDRRGKMTINGNGNVHIGKSCLECAMNVIASDVRLTGLIFDAAYDHSDNPERCLLSLRLPENCLSEAYYMDNIHIVDCVFSHVAAFGVATCGDYGNAAKGYNEAGTANFSNLVIAGNQLDGTGIFSFCGAGDEDYNIVDGYYVCGNTLTDAGIGMVASDAHTWYVYEDRGEILSGKIAYCEYNILRNVLIAGNSITMTENAPNAWVTMIGVTSANLGNSHSTVENVEIRHNQTRITRDDKNMFAMVSVCGTVVADGYEDGRYYGDFIVPGMERTDYNEIRNVYVHHNDFQVGSERELRVCNVFCDEGYQCGSHNKMSGIRVEHNTIDAPSGVSICNMQGSILSGACNDNHTRNISFMGNTLVRHQKKYIDTGVLIANTSVSQYGQPLCNMPDYSGTMRSVSVYGNTISNFQYGIVACGAAGAYGEDEELEDVTIENNRIVNYNYNPYPIVDMGIVVAGSALQSAGTDEYPSRACKDCAIENVSVSGNDITAGCGVCVCGLLATETIRTESTGHTAASVTVRDNTIARRAMTASVQNYCPPVITGDIVEASYKLGYGGKDRYAMLGGCNAERISVGSNSYTGFTETAAEYHDVCRTNISGIWSWLSDGETVMAKRPIQDLWVYGSFEKSQLKLAEEGQSVAVDFTICGDEIPLIAFFTEDGRMISCSAAADNTQTNYFGKPQEAVCARAFFFSTDVPVCPAQEISWSASAAK